MHFPLRIVVLGDSVTAGTDFCGVTNGNSYIALLQHRLASTPAVEVIPSALEGVDTGYALRRFDRMVTTHRPDLVFVMLGLNDARPAGGRAAASPEEYRENLLKLTNRILALDAKPVLSTPTPRLDVRPEPENGHDIMQSYVRVVRDVADDHHLSWIDVYSRFLAQRDVQSLIPDGVHPGPRGHAIIADAFAETMNRLCGDVCTTSVTVSSTAAAGSVGVSPSVAQHAAGQEALSVGYAALSLQSA